MPSTIGTAYIQIEPSTQGISGSIENLLNNEAGDAGKKAGNTFGNAMGSALKTGGKIAMGAVAGLATATTALSGAMADGISNLAQYGDNIDKMSQKMGMSAEAYQEWDFVMQHNGTTIEGLKASMKTLANSANTNSEAFEKLGISQEEIAKLSQEELFSKTIEQLQGVEDTTERTYLAGKLLGKGATELGALLNMSAEDTKAMKEQAHELGGVLSDEAVKASATFQDSLQNLQTAFSGLQRGALANFLPSVTSIMDGLTAIFSGDGSGVELINQGITSFIDNMSTVLPSVMEIGKSIILTLGDAIVQNLPSLMSSGSEIILEICQSILSNLPSILESALQVIVTLAQGIAQSLPTMIPTIIDVVISISEMLIDNVDLLIDGAIALVIGLANGIFKALPQLIQRIPELVLKIVDAVITNAPKLMTGAVQLVVSLAKGIVQAIPQALTAIGQLISQLISRIQSFIGSFTSIGSNIIQGIKNGIANAWNNLVSWFSGLFDDLIGVAKRILQIASPSKVFKKIGQFTTEGFDIGMKDFGQGAIDTVKSSIDELTGLDYANTIVAGNTAINSAEIQPQTDNSQIMSLLSQYLPSMAQPTNVNVGLQGDASGIFRVVRQEANKFTKSTGYSAFA